MDSIAFTRPPTSPQGSALYMRVYALDRNGRRTELPVVEPKRVGVCGVLGCTCLEPSR